MGTTTKTTTRIIGGKTYSWTKEVSDEPVTLTDSKGHVWTARLSLSEDTVWVSLDIDGTPVCKSTNLYLEDIEAGVGSIAHGTRRLSVREVLTGDRGFCHPGEAEWDEFVADCDEFGDNFKAIAALAIEQAKANYWWDAVVRGALALAEERRQDEEDLASLYR